MARALLLALLVAGGVAAEARAEDGVVDLVAGRFALGHSESPPPEASPDWARVSLPDFWLDSRPREEGFGWYHFELPRPAEVERDTQERWAVLLTDLQLAVAVSVNGEQVGQCGEFTSTRELNCLNRPAFFTFRAGLLDRPVNAVDVRLYGTQWSWARLTNVTVGPERVLAPRASRDLFVRKQMAEFGTMLGIAIAVFVGVIWLARPGDSVYGYFVLASIAWTINNTNFHLNEYPVSYRAWQHVVHPALDWFAIGGVFMMHRLVGVRRRRIERLLLAYGACTIVVPLLVPLPLFDPVENALHLIALLLTGYAFARIWREFYALPRLEFALVGTAAALVLVLGVHDYLLQTRVILHDGLRLLPYAGLLILLAAGSTLVVRFARAYNRAENLNAELEARVREKHQELEANFERMRALEGERARAGEREKLLREVHDGIGAQLVSTLALVEADPISRADVSEALRGTLDEMRILLQSLDPSIEDLPTLLGIMRARIEPRLAARGLRFDWRVGDLPPMPELGHDGFLHVLRIVQEAITNVLKHGKARVIAISTGLRAACDGREGVFIEVRDDGVGLAGLGTDAHGRGLTNMRSRAAELGGELSVASTDPGTSVNLWLPLSRSS